MVSFSSIARMSFALALGLGCDACGGGSRQAPDGTTAAAVPEPRPPICREEGGVSICADEENRSSVDNATIDVQRQ